MRIEEGSYERQRLIKSLCVLVNLGRLSVHAVASQTTSLFNMVS
ncbi:hypothetical protein NTGM5_400005 [Candidatus Nitrotoga sp. M5]|nr:hypothetical protein NTGM5_400005 [Candidatus Nitrotoga sp. M5]